MGSFKRPRAYDPLDLEIMDLVYEAAWAQLEAREPLRDREKDGERQIALRRLVFNSVGTDKINFDTLCDRVLASMPETWFVFRPGQPRSSPKVSA
jgi:hypothetical protein